MSEQLGYSWLTKKYESSRAKVEAELLAQSKYPPGTIFVGGRDFDDTLDFVVCEAFKIEYDKSRDKMAAYEAACKAGREAVKIWNERTSKGRASFFSRQELRHSETAGESLAMGLLAMFR